MAIEPNGGIQPCRIGQANGMPAASTLACPACLAHSQLHMGTLLNPRHGLAPSSAARLGATAGCRQLVTGLRLLAVVARRHVVWCRAASHGHTAGCGVPQERERLAREVSSLAERLAGAQDALRMAAQPQSFLVAQITELKQQLAAVQKQAGALQASGPPHVHRPACPAMLRDSDPSRHKRRLRLPD